MGGVNIQSGILSLDLTEPFDYNPSESEIEKCQSLTELADVFGSDKGSIKHNYTKSYEKYLIDFKNQELCLGEIGVACGASLKMWSKYFPKGKIYGFDIRPECAKLAENYKNIHIHILDATKEKLGIEFDILIDDGSHISKDIRDAFILNFNFVKSGGWYFIEDTFCTFNPNYPNLIPFVRDINDFDRRYFLGLVDFLLRDLDANPNTAIDEIVVHKQLVGIRKK